MQSVYDATRRNRTSGFRHGDRIDLFHCRTGSEFLGRTPDDLLPAFADVALDVIMWRTDLTEAGYPSPVWRAALTDYEQSAVDTVIRKAKAGALADADFSPPERFFDALKGRLDAHHAAHPKTIAVIKEGGCGAVEAHVNLATSPSGGQVMVIPTFYYDLCKVQKQNADDARACPNWREALDGKVTEVAGDYVYQVRWHDGSVRRGKLSFDYNDDGHTITLRKL